MIVHNVHERRFSASTTAVGALLDSLAGKDDRLWPRAWPPILFDRPLAVGARGGHGPIRYDIEAYSPGRSITFRFTAPRGFDGTHGLEIIASADGAILRHVVTMETSPLAWLSWSVMFGPLHDALLEDALDRAELALTGSIAHRAHWTWWVRTVRRFVTLSRSRTVSRVRDDAYVVATDP